MLAALAAENVPGMQSFHLSRADAVHELLSQRLSRHRFDCQRDVVMDARIYSLDVGAIQVVDLQYGADVDVEAHIEEDYFLVHLALAGETTMSTKGQRHRLGPNELLISSPKTPLKVQMTAHCRHLAVRVPVSVCTDYIGQSLHIPVKRPLEFYAEQQGSRELPQVWRGMIAHMIDTLRVAPGVMSSRRLQHHYAELLAEVLLDNYSNSYSEQIALYGNDISPRHVRRAREIIHKSLEETIAIGQLAEQVGVSVRSLQNGFRQFLGVTPVEYVRRHRLEKLHDALSRNDGQTSVTQLMLECGIVNFGRYAQYYRQQYGCLPSENLRRHH